MPPSRRETYDWYEDTDALEAPRGLTTVPGNPASLRQFSWWLAAIAFSAIWMVETWKAALRGQVPVGPMAEKSLGADLGAWYLLWHLQFQQIAVPAARASSVCCKRRRPTAESRAR